MSKILHIVHNIIWGLLFLSLAVNAYFICINIHNAGQTGSAGEGLEDELNNAASSITSASGTTEQVANGLITVSNELGESQATTNKLISTTKESVKGCGDVEQTVADLRKKIEVLENDYNSSVNSGSSD